MGRTNPDGQTCRRMHTQTNILRSGVMATTSHSPQAGWTTTTKFQTGPNKIHYQSTDSMQLE